MATKKTGSEKTTKNITDWNKSAIVAWSNGATPGTRLAMWLLANGNEMSTHELNGVITKVGFDGSIGAIVGGIKAYATRHGLPSPLVDGYHKGDEGEKKRVYWMRKKLRKQFLNLLKDSQEVNQCAQSVGRNLLRIWWHPVKGTSRFSLIAASR